MFTSEFRKQIRWIEVTSRKIVEGLLAGRYRTRFKGQGMQFAEHRIYTPGDDIRHIDWKASARTREPLVKTFDEERELSVFLVVDISQSQVFGTYQTLKSEIAAQLSALLAHVAVYSGDQVGLLLFADQVEKIIPPKKARNQALKIVKTLLTHQPCSGGTNLALALNTVGRFMKHRGVVIIISDFLVSHYEVPLKKLAQRHEILAIELFDQRERIFPHLNWCSFTDAETGQTQFINSHSVEFQKWFEQIQKKWDFEKQKIFKKAQVEVLSIETREAYTDQLVEFFRKRKKGA